jgi:hypothetical protein
LVALLKEVAALFLISTRAAQENQRTLLNLAILIHRGAV